MLQKINVKKIIVSHFKTLVNNNTHKLGSDDIITFFLIPILAGGLLTYFKESVSQNTVNLLITALSIFVGLLINVLVLIFSIIQKEAASNAKIEVLEETITNISYCIVVSILCICFCFCMSFDSELVKLFASFFIYTFTIHFFITLMMVLKRMYLLFINEIDDVPRSKKEN